MKIETYQIWETEEYSYEHAFGFIPKITAYLHEDGVKRPCILVAPGGGYCIVSPSEGELVALKFYEKGYQTFVLTYTVNLLQTAPLKLQPLHDISRAVRYIRRYAEKFAVEEKKLALCGFSAGGHLCGSLCVHYEDIQDTGEEYCGISNCPDAAVLSYPVITSGEKAHKESFISLYGDDAAKADLEYMSLEKHVKEQTPPCFLWATATDELVPVENSEMFAKACRAKGVLHALHIFSRGKHGLSLADEDWAGEIHRNSYTLEQVERIISKAQEGELLLPEALLKELEEGRKKQECNSVEKPNQEVAVWPELADIFLKKYMKI